MSGVTCLSGVLETLDGERLAFSLMMNGFTGSSRPLRAVQDSVVSALRSVPRRPIPPGLGPIPPR